MKRAAVELALVASDPGSYGSSAYRVNPLVPSTPRTLLLSTSSSDVVATELGVERPPCTDPE